MKRKENIDTEIKERLDSMRKKLPKSNKHSKKDFESIINLWKKHKNTKEIHNVSGITLTSSNTLMKVLRPYILEEFISLMQQSVDFVAISKKIGISRRILKKWEKKYNLSKLRVKKGYSKAIIDPYVLAKEFMMLKGLNVLEDIFNADHRTIKKRVKELGFVTDGESNTRSKVKLHVENRGNFGYSYPIPENSVNSELITGILLGDGNIKLRDITKDGVRKVVNNPYIIPYSKSDYLSAIKILNDLKMTSVNEENLASSVKKYNRSVKVISSFPTGSFRLRNHFKETPWVDLIGDGLEKLGLTTVRNMTEKGETEINGTLYDCGDQWGFETNGTIELGLMYLIWYSGEDHKKIVPRYISKLTPNIVPGWFVGDGTFSSNIQFATNSFSKEDNEYLIQLLSNIGIKAYLNSGKNSDGESYYFLGIGSKESKQRLLDFMELADPTALMVAKATLPWKFDEDLYWNDFKHIFKAKA